MLPGITGSIREGGGYTALHGDPRLCGDLRAGDCLSLIKRALLRNRWPALTRYDCLPSVAGSYLLKCWNSEGVDETIAPESLAVCIFSA